jgi:hypothetical protein
MDQHPKAKVGVQGALKFAISAKVRHREIAHQHDEPRKVQGRGIALACKEQGNKPVPRSGVGAVWY